MDLPWMQNNARAGRVDSYKVRGKALIGSEGCFMGGALSHGGKGRRSNASDEQ